MKRPLLVFAGQSNMMGAGVYPPEQIFFERSFEYLHKPKRLGQRTGAFKKYGFPSGEFAYKSLPLAYGETNNVHSQSTLSDYHTNTFFGPSMSNLEDASKKTVKSFSSYSEADFIPGTSLAPYVVSALEKNGYTCLYTHIAKGSVPISYYTESAAANYFEEKCRDFFEDAQSRFGDDDLSERILLWHQGESDAKNGYDHYKKHLSILWKKAKDIGFTKFFIIRVGYWGNDAIAEVMRAQEDFAKQTEGVYMLTRAASYLLFNGHKTDGWFSQAPGEEYENCRDSFFGFSNQHINDKGFRLVATRATDNIIRIVFENRSTVLEDELIVPLLVKTGTK